MRYRIIVLGYLMALAIPVVAYASTALGQPLTASAEARPDVQVFAMSTFVEQNCVGLHLNKANARDLFYRAGGSPTWKDNPFHQSMVREQVETLRGDVPRNCTKLWNLYGANGAVQPGIIEADAVLPPGLDAPRR